MLTINRRTACGSLVAMLSTLIGTRSTLAQHTEQEIRNGLQVVSTGDVNVSQDAAGNQEIFAVNGTAIHGDGVYQTSTGQVIVNDGQVVATGDVDVSQRAAGSQTVFTITSGQRAEVCNPGHVLADPTTGQLFYQANDCCYYPACAAPCKERCKGKGC